MRNSRSSEMKELRRRLEEAEETLRAIRSGEVDALVVSGQQGAQVYTLKDADRPYRALIEEMNEGALTLTAKGDVAYANQRVAKLLGLSLEEILGQDLARFCTAEDQPRFQALLDEALAGSSKGEIALVAAASGPIPVEFSFRRLELEGIPHLSAILVDLRWRRQAQNALRESEARYRHLFERNLAGVYRTTLDPHTLASRRLDCNDAFARILGYASRAELLDQPVHPVFPSEEAWKAYARLLLEKKMLTNHELELKRRDGSPVWAVVNATVRQDEQPGMMLIEGTFIDISERKRAEQSLQEAMAEIRELNATLERRVAERTTELQEANADLQEEIAEREAAESELVQKNRDLAVLFSISRATAQWVNPDKLLEEALLAILQALEIEAGGCYLVSPDGETLILQTHRGLSPEFIDAVKTLRRAEGIAGKAAAEKRAVVLDVSQYPTEALLPALIRERLQTLASVPILWHDEALGVVNLVTRSRRPFSSDELTLLGAIGQQLGIAVRNARLYETVQRELAARHRAGKEIARLNQDLRRRAAELEAANRELEAFAYSVSHDLRAPLHGINSFARVLLDEYGAGLPAEAKRYAELVQENTEELIRLVEAMLSLSRLGRQPLNKQVVSTAGLVHQVLEDLQSERAGRRVEIVLGDLPDCEADPVLLKQVYMNLISNALKFTRTREVAQIVIGSTSKPETVFFVRDNGVGFDMEQAKQLFGVFQRFHHVDEYEGTGVGLAIVERIIHRHGGRVWAEAAADQGATFFFTLDGVS